MATPSGQSETYRCTDTHPFWMEKGGDDGEGGFLAARSLRTGDQLRLGDGSPAYVTSVEATGIIEPVYNFSVDGWKTYHVGELGVWVHNVCIDDIPRFGFSPYNLAQKDAINQTRVLIRNGANADSVPEAIRAQWGKEFRNDYGDLPTRIGGSPVQGYREYTIDPGPFNQADRGSHRVVVGTTESGRTYEFFTGTHYGDNPGRAFWRL